MKRVLQNQRVWAVVGVLFVGAVLIRLAGGQSVGRAEYEVYRCQHKTAQQVGKLLEDLLPDDPSVHLVVDEQSNSLLLRGNREAQKVAASLLQHVDRPAAAAPPKSSGSPVVKAYDCPAQQLDRCAEVARSVCGNSPGVRVTVERQSNRLFVLAPPKLHDLLARRLARGEGPADAGPAVVDRPSDEAAPGGESSPPPRRLPVPSRAGPGEPNSAGGNGAQQPVAEVDRMLHLRNLHPKELEQRLIALFGRRLRATSRDGHEVFVLPLDQQRSISFQFDPRRSLVLVRGANKLVAQFTLLVDALDASGRAGLTTQALRLERTADDKLQEAVDAYRGEAPKQGGSAPSWSDQSHHARPSGGTRLVSYLFHQQPAAGAAGAGAEPAEPGEAADVPSVPGLNDLEVQTLPDLDVIILRGRDQDVEQLTEIIRELERLSAETSPKIFIYRLKHAQSEALDEIIEEVQEDLVGRRQGRVTVTPLVKPNSLLLIGWGDAVDAIVELISKLDRPVPPESQFEVFALRHAAAVEVQQTVVQFLGARPGLGPRVEAAVDERTNSLIVYAAPRDMEEVRRLISEIDVPQGKAINRVRIFRIDDTLATEVATMLEQAIAAAQAGETGRSAVLQLLSVDEQGKEVVRSGLLNNVSVTPNPRNNSLIVTAPPEAMDLLEAFIEQLDTPGDRAQIKVFRVINADATNLVSTLRALIPAQVGQPELGLQLPTAPEEESLAPLRFAVEVRSNSIIAVGSEGDLRIVEALIQRLDQSESMERKNAVYLLKNAPAIDVAASINEFLRSQRVLEAAQPGQVNPFQELEREVIVVPEPVGNKLIVSATPRYFEEITQLIEKLDEPPPQVVIQVLIAEITLGDRDEFGVELGLQDSVLFDRSLLGDLLTTTETTQRSDPSGIVTTTEQIIQAATNSPGYLFNNQDLGNSGSDKALAGSKNLAGQALSSFQVDRTSDDADFGGLVLAASSRNISILIRALQEDREMRILSRPLVRTLDNQPAFIQVGQRVPRIIGTTIGLNGQSNQISLENVGLILGVTPRISPDGNVVMEIDAEKSSVGPEDEGIPVGTSTEGTVIRSPRVDTITAQATVSVADGETVVLGGMISKDTEEVARRIPYLADLPVLGHLFRFDQFDELRTEMLIVLTPKVIRKPADAERIKQAEFARMSWCAADVYEMYGDIGIDFQPGLAVPQETGATDVIYPDANPRGESLPGPGPLPQQGTPSGEIQQLPGEALPLPEGSEGTPPQIPPLPQGARQPPVPGQVQPAGGWGTLDTPPARSGESLSATPSYPARPGTAVNSWNGQLRPARYDARWPRETTEGGQ